MVDRRDVEVDVAVALGIAKLVFEQLDVPQLLLADHVQEVAVPRAGDRGLEGAGGAKATAAMLMMPP